MSFKLGWSFLFEPVTCVWKKNYIVMLSPHKSCIKSLGMSYSNINLTNILLLFNVNLHKTQ